ncbi:MAG TPA: prolyl oligopeptidase family serine peptidase [Ramlibacter sp.]|nr:prolyl oligopeptidase family serine peptidase [Ramlibacter sp.]
MKNVIAAAAFVLGAVGAWAQSPGLPSVEAFFSKPDIREAVISPTGRFVALASKNKDGHEQLVVLDTAKLTANVVASFTTGDVVNVRWLSDKRLVYSAADADRETSALAVPLGLYAVNVDGTDFRNLIPMPSGQGVQFSAPTAFTTRFLATTWMKDSDDVFVTQAKFTNKGEFELVRLLRMDSHTSATKTWTPPGDVFDWYLGPGDEPKYVVTRGEGMQADVLYSEGGAWKKVSTFNRFLGGDFEPVGYGPGGITYVAHRGNSDTTELFTFDPKTQQFSADPIISAKGFDLSPRMLRSGDRVIGIRYMVDAQSTHWFDPEMKKLQAKIDATMPGTVNRIDVPLRPEVPFVLVHAHSDVDPGQFYLYDTKAEKLVKIGHYKKDIDPRQMAPLDLSRIKARDGLEFPVWVTKPKGAKGPMPAVVLVHGGPWVRGTEWGWDRDSQFLASRGYVVIEPEYRGSTGYGFRLFRAGWKQWGLAMQNDVADATRWAIEKGIADPKRICIAGASYGGYATLMGLANDPDLYRCGFEWVGVTDIDLMYSIHWSDFSDDYKSLGMPVLVADREKDAAQIKATSPIAKAALIKQPLLMGYGAADYRVPIDHGRDFRAAVEKTNPNVEWVVYSDEGHGWRQLKDNVDWWTRVEKFLARNIGQ